MTAIVLVRWSGSALTLTGWGIATVTVVAVARWLFGYPPRRR